MLTIKPTNAMRRNNAIRSLLILLFTGFASGAWAQKVVTYQRDNRNFANPERGFYTQRWLFPGERLSAASLATLREQEQVTLIRIPFRVPDFRNKPFSPEVLTTMEEAFNAARAAGLKVIPRVVYSYGPDEPDAPLAVVLQHIEQIKPIVRRHADVIAFMNAGFIGAWGEWHSSSNGLADDNQARRAILFALLDALPPERMVNLRYNYHKRPIFGTDNPLTESEGFNGSRRARTGALNDCFRASFDDVGTYTWRGDIEGEKDYLNQDNRFVPQSGETCGQSEYSDCATSLKDLKRMRWDALNRDFDETVLNDWKAQGCYSTVSQKLGYRFALQRAIVPDTPLSAGQTFNATVTLLNEGWGKVYNPRRPELILRNQESGKTITLPLDQDPRRWLLDEGIITVNIQEKLPVDAGDGTYQLLLNLPDPAPALAKRPEYSIRFANQGTWEASTGYNDLQATVTITTNGPPASGAGTGLRYALYPNRNLTGSPTKTGTDATVNFDWQSAGKAAGLPRDNFSVRWTGQVQAQYSEAYTFSTRSDDGVRLWVNGKKLIDHWTDHAVREARGTITLQAGKKYDIKLEYYEHQGKAVCQLRWSSASQAKQVIPQSRLYAPGNNARSLANAPKGAAGEPAVSIYPNPVDTDGLTITLPPGTTQGTLSIVSLSGQEMLRQAFTGSSFSVSRQTLAKGTYLVRITTDQVTHTQKIVVP